MKNSIRRFEDIVAWQESRTLVGDVYRISYKIPFSRDFALRNQIRSSAISVPSNIAEGFERWTRPEFRRFLSMAKGSCAELRTQLYLALDLGYLDDSTFHLLMDSAESVSRLIGKLRSSIQGTQQSARSTHDPAPGT
jgi:four helix bundle protein